MLVCQSPTEYAIQNSIANSYLYKAKTSSMVCEKAYVIDIFYMAKYSKNILSMLFLIQQVFFSFSFSLSRKSVLGPLKNPPKRAS